MINFHKFFMKKIPKRCLFRRPLSISLETNHGLGSDGGILIFVKDADDSTLITARLAETDFDKFVDGYLRQRGLNGIIARNEDEEEE